MDSLIITGLSVASRIGVHDWEQRISQRLLIDIHIPSDFKECKDDLADTIDYSALCQLVTEYIEGRVFKLIETVANELATLIKNKFALDQQVTVSVSKPNAIKTAANVKVTVIR